MCDNYHLQIIEPKGRNYTWKNKNKLMQTSYQPKGPMVYMRTHALWSDVVSLKQKHHHAYITSVLNNRTKKSPFGALLFVLKLFGNSSNWFGSKLGTFTQPGTLFLLFLSFPVQMCVPTCTHTLGLGVRSGLGTK